MLQHRAKLGTFHNKKQTYDICPSKSNLGNILGEGTEAITTTTMVVRRGSN